jgi:hypothetical protein
MLIEPGAASDYRARLLSERLPVGPGRSSGQGADGDAPSPQINETGESSYSPVERPQHSQKKRFFGTVELNPLTAKRDFATVVDEVILHFTTVAGAKVRLRVDLEVEGSVSFSDAVVRIVSENARSLKFKPADFDE